MIEKLEEALTEAAERTLTEVQAERFENAVVLAQTAELLAHALNLAR